ncbi:MAG: hypothetical protein ACLRZ9_04345 [Eubacterium sp.]
MEMNKISSSVAVEGRIFECPAKLLLGKHNNDIMFCGTLQWGEKKLSESLSVVDAGMSGSYQNYINDLLPEKFPKELTVTYQNKLLILGIQDQNLYFKVAVCEESKAILFAFKLEKCENAGDKTSKLVEALKKVADFWGIDEFVFLAQTGEKWLLPKLNTGRKFDSNVPKEIQNCGLLTYAHISMDGDSVFKKAVKTLFGLKETELFLGVGKKDFLCMITIPEFKTSFLESKNLYLLMELGKKSSFRLKGSFIFSFIKEVTFMVDCGIGTDAFAIEALAHVEKPVSLFGPFSIGDTCLMIRMSTELMFGMYTNLYIRNIQLFGALILSVKAGSVVPRLLSAAVSDLSIPILLDNLLGKHIPGTEVLDFIKIMGLPFQDMIISEDSVKEKNLPAIVDQFNQKMNNDSLKLDLEQTQITPFGEGVDVTDLKRMRHYYIGKDYRMKLTAQFYYSTIEMTFGNYNVERGIFVCGVISIFNKQFEVLFSLREEEGILAYAKIPSIDLKFLKIGASTFSKNENNALPLKPNSVMAQFINPNQSGAVFFLSANKKDVFFYLDGSVSLLGLFSVDARVIFCKGLISIDLRFVWLAILQISLHISVNYKNFSTGGFEFCLVIDTSKLTEKLNKVTEKIEGAIKKLRAKIDNAKKEIDRAQAHVNELYGQINNFNRKIQDCKNAIKKAKWWKKAFVAIAKGIEIGAYEVAKAGIYAAIGVATAALQVAKKVVELSGKIGEGVMKAVNAVIKGAMSLFYINYIKLAAKANAGEKNFQAEIEFVALGKTYRLSKTIGMKNMQNSPTDELSGHINKGMQNDLDNIEKGAFKSNWQRYQHENYTIEQHCKRLEGARTNLNSCVSLMKSMQNTYVQEFNAPMAEFEEMNVSLAEALDSVENVLDTGAQAGDVSQLASSMGGLKRSVAYREKMGVYRDEELAQTKEVIAQYDEARLFYDKVMSEIKDVQRKRKDMELHCEKLQKQTETVRGEQVINGQEGNMGKVLQQVEEKMYENFPVDRSGKDFINLSREPLIQECFIEAEKEEGILPTDTIKRMRNRSRKGKYESRL